MTRHVKDSARSNLACVPSFVSPVCPGVSLAHLCGRFFFCGTSSFGVSLLLCVDAPNLGFSSVSGLGRLSFGGVCPLFWSRLATSVGCSHVSAFSVTANLEVFLVSRLAKLVVLSFLSLFVFHATLVSHCGSTQSIQEAIGEFDKCLVLGTRHVHSPTLLPGQFLLLDGSREVRTPRTSDFPHKLRSYGTWKGANDSQAPSLSAAPGLLGFGSMFRTLRRHSGQLLRQRQSGSFTDVAASCLIPGSALRDGFSHVLGLRIIVPEALRRPSGQLLRQRQCSPHQTLRRLFRQLLRQRQSLVDLSILDSCIFSRLG